MFRGDGAGEARGEAVGAQPVVVDELFETFEQRSVVDEDEAVAVLDFVVEGGLLPGHGEDEGGVGAMLLRGHADEEETIAAAEALEQRDGAAAIQRFVEPIGAGRSFARAFVVVQQVDHVRMSLRQGQRRFLAIRARAEGSVERQKDLDAVQMPVGGGLVKRDPPVQGATFLNVSATLEIQKVTNIFQ